MSRPLRRVPVVLLLAAAIAVAARAQSQGPLALHAPPLLVPEEAAGTGVAPEAALRISIDARGVVTKVEVVSITPSTEYDQAFRRSLVESIAAWRFAPALRDGRPEPSTLDWRVRFPARAAPEIEGHAGAALLGGDAEQRRSAIRALPQRQRAALLEAQVRTAVRLLDPQRVQKAESPRFVVHTDAERSAAAAIANNMEAIFNVLAQEVLPGVDLQREPYKVQVVAYRSQASYLALVREMPVYELSAGFYSPAGFIAFHLEQPTSDAVMSLLMHEATHAFVDRHVVRPGVALPRWLGEGFADYVGNSQIRDGRLQPGRTLRRKLAFERGVLVDLRTTAGVSLDAARDALRRGKGLGVEEMLAASPEIFYGDRSGLYYASSWLLVHYLRDGGEGWARDRFPRLLLYLAEGYPVEAAFRTVYGAPASADAAFRQYVKAF